MAEDTQTKIPAVFSRETILKKQGEAQEAYDKQIKELRQTFELVAATPSGAKLLQYLFILCGGDAGSIRRDKSMVIDVNETLVTLGSKGIWENIRFNLSSKTLEKIERHTWEQ